MTNFFLSKYFIVGLLIVILGLHNWALVAEGYWRIGWLDMLLHFLGGFLIAVFALWFLYYSPHTRNFSAKEWPSYIVFIGIIGFAALIGVGWEFFEFLYDFFISSRHSDLFRIAQLSSADTISDLFFDLLGALIAMILLLRKQK